MGNKLGILFFMTTISAQANAIVPLINIFTPQTMLPASILTVIIILIEMYILRRWAKNIRLIQHLKYSTLNNLMSSFVGSVFVWVYMMEKPLWEIMVMYPIMFIVTLLVETPLLKKEYPDKLKTWRDAIERSLSLHLGSYILIFLFQPIFFIIWGYYGNYMDENAIKNWTNTSVLKYESGEVYMIKSSYENNNRQYELYKYDIKSKTKSKISIDLKMDDRKTIWDIKDKEFVYTGIGDFIYRVNMQTKQNISQFKIYKSIEQIRISPDKKMIAILEYEREVKVKKDEYSYYRLGSACKLKLYNLESGKLLKEVPRLALNTAIVWGDTSEYIYFVSQKNKDDFFQNEVLKNITHFYGRGYIKDGSYAREIFKYSLLDNRVSPLINAEQIVGIMKNQLFFIKNESLKKLDINRLVSSTIYQDGFNSYSYALSPTGKNILMLIRHKSLMSHSDFLSIQNIKDRNKKVLLDKDYNGEFRWVK